MGKIFKSKFSTLLEVISIVVVLFTVGYTVNFFAPGYLSKGSTVITGGEEVDNTEIRVDMSSAKLSLPESTLSTKVATKPLFRVSGYVWWGQTPMLTANGGQKTTKNSLMELNNVNFEFIRQDALTDIRNNQLAFIEEFDKGNVNPKTGKASAGISIMGDGVRYYIETTQKTIDYKYGKGKYNLEIVGSVGGLSYGEDKVIGPAAWKTNPKLMLGSLISVVPGDGDWVVLMNYCKANQLPVNRDFDTYDKLAVNIRPSENDDYIKSAEELVSSQISGKTYKLEIIENNKRTGKYIDKTVDGCATWSPGDQIALDKLASKNYTDIISTKDFKNQMPTTLVVVKEWAHANKATIINFLKATYAAANQMQLYDEWYVKASEVAAKSFNFQTPKYWYEISKGIQKTSGSNSYQIGGTRILNYNEILHYYGLSGDNIDRYKSVYEQSGYYLREMNPFDYDKNATEPIEYTTVMNLSYIQEASTQSADVVETDYNYEAKTTVASGNYYINFDVGSDVIQASSYRTLDELYNILIQAEDYKINITGHTDNTGDYNLNKNLSERRANSVYVYFGEKGLPYARVQNIAGAGPDKPLDNNTTASGRAKNRRVEVSILKQ